MSLLRCHFPATLLPHLSGKLFSILKTQYSFLQWAPLGGEPKNIGVLLFDPSSDTLHWKFVEDWTEITPDSIDQEYLALWSAEFADRVFNLGPEGFLNHLEDTLSNAVRITDRKVIASSNLEASLEELFRTHVRGKARGAG